MLTKAKLEKFVKIRNKSGFSSNLQFQIDAEQAGFKVSDLGDTVKFKLDGATGYQWDVEVAEIGQSLRTNLREVRMVEFGGRLYLDHDPHSVQFLEHLKKHGELIETAA